MTKDIKKLDINGLKNLSNEIREQIIKTVSKNGGHLSSNLGATELIVAMHYVFDSKSDPFIFDVSHQSYAHKIITGRKDTFNTLRTLGGISGYTKPSESSSDYFVAGHSSTSISLALGAAKAIRLKKEEKNRRPIALIGDGSMTSGMVYEALNELGDTKHPVIIILNDNKMSIAKPIGALSKFLSQAIAGETYQNMKKQIQGVLKHLPDSATYMAKKFEDSIKLITPGVFFEEMGIDYIGPIDGHDLEEIINAYELAKNMDKPVLIHAQTLKGKGYEIAEGYEESWHGVGAFDVNSGAFKRGSKKLKDATTLFSEALLKEARKNEKIVGVTAAMPSGTGMAALLEEFPNRFWDVAIAEQHAVTSMCAMAKEGFKPFVAIYSTFLQRAYDQIIHDACIMNLPVVFAIDRAGIVGEDGETHQGVFDISYLSAMPNITLFAPRDADSMHEAIRFASTCKGVCAFRYPRGYFGADEVAHFTSTNRAFELGKSELLHVDDSDILLIGYGNGVGKALKVKEELNKKNITCSVLDLRFAKPLDEAMLKELSTTCKHWFIISDSAKIGGIGSLALEFLAREKITGLHVKSYEYEDSFITHGNSKLVEESLGILPHQIADDIAKTIR